MKNIVKPLIASSAGVAAVVLMATPAFADHRLGTAGAEATCRLSKSGFTGMINCTLTNNGAGW